MNLTTITKPNQIFNDTLFKSFLEICARTTISPILNATFVIKKNNKHYYLSNQKQSSLYYEICINQNSKLEEIILLIKINNMHLLTTLEKTNLITIASQHVSYKECCELLKQLNLAAQEQIVRQCIKINKFPDELLNKFNENYSISIKQLFYYDRFENQFLKWYSTHIIDPFKLSFSQFNNFLDQLYNLKNRSIQEFESCIDRINKIDKTQKDIQIKLRQTIYKSSFPTLYKANKLMEEKITELNLPDKISISWDKSLENKQLNICITCNKKEDMKLLDSLKEKQSKLNNLLNNFGYENS
jgi:hypothetical protein